MLTDVLSRVRHQELISHYVPNLFGGYDPRLPLVMPFQREHNATTL